MPWLLADLNWLFLKKMTFAASLGPLNEQALEKVLSTIFNLLRTGRGLLFGTTGPIESGPILFGTNRINQPDQESEFLTVSFFWLLNLFVSFKKK
jgi:hypothetical protein